MRIKKAGCSSELRPRQFVTTRVAFDEQWGNKEGRRRGRPRQRTLLNPIEQSLEAEDVHGGVWIQAAEVTRPT
jgi:hypothetical protein